MTLLLFFFAVLGLAAVAIDMRRELRRSEKLTRELERAFDENVGGR